MSEYDYLLKELEKIKNGEDSFLGCDGGNINAKIWFCGIEFGGTPEEMNTYYKDYIIPNINDENKIPYRKKYTGKFLQSPFDRYLTIMYLILLKGYNFDKNVDSNLISNVLKSELYNKDSESFKLNLFPIAKKNVSWNKKIEEELKVDRNEYYSTLFNKRAKFFKKIISRFTPETIICFSTKNYSDLFIKAFLSKKNKIEFQYDIFIDRNNKEHFIKIIHYKKTKYIIMPFLGMGNLTNHEDVINISEFIKENYINS